jgi:hypothetical protein
VAARVYHSVESLTTTRTDSISGASYADKFTLSYTPDASSTYMLWGMSEMNHQTATTDSYFELYDSVGGAQMEELNIEPDSAGDEWKNFAVISKETFGGSPAAQTVKGRFKTESVGNWTDIRNARGGALKLTANDFMTEVDAQQNITITESNGTWFSTNGVLTETVAAGDYVLIAYCQCGINSAGINAQLRVDIDGTTQSEPWETTHKDTSNWDHWTFVDILTLSAASHTITIQALRTGGTFRLRKFKIALLSVAEFEATYSNKDFTRSTTTSTTYTNIGPSVTFTPENVDHLIIANWAYDGTDGTDAGFTELSDGTTQYNEHQMTSISTTKARQQGNFSMFIKQLPASSQTFAVNGKVVTGNTLGVDEGIIFIAQLESTASTYEMIVDPAELTVTPKNISLEFHRKLNISPADLSLTGKDISLQYHRKLNVSPAELQVTGQDIGMHVRRHLLVDPAALSISPQGISLELHRKLSVLPAELLVLPQEVSFEYHRKLNISPAELALTGQPISLELHRRLSIAPAELTLTPQPVSMEFHRKLSISPAALALTGYDVTLTYVPSFISYQLDVSPTHLNLTGQPVTLTYHSSSAADMVYYRRRKQRLRIRV